MGRFKRSKTFCPCLYFTWAGQVQSRQTLWVILRPSLHFHITSLGRGSSHQAHSLCCRTCICGAKESWCISRKFAGMIWNSLLSCQSHDIILIVDEVNGGQTRPPDIILIYLLGKIELPYSLPHVTWEHSSLLILGLIILVYDCLQLWTSGWQKETELTMA